MLGTLDLSRERDPIEVRMYEQYVHEYILVLGRIID